MILASIVTGAVGLSPIVGALIAGVLIAETEYQGEVELMTAPFKGLALGVFLITVGMSLDLAVIAARWSALLLAVTGVVLAKALVRRLKWKQPWFLVSAIAREGTWEVALKIQDFFDRLKAEAAEESRSEDA